LFFGSLKKFNNFCHISDHDNFLTEVNKWPVSDIRESCRGVKDYTGYTYDPNASYCLLQYFVTDKRDIYIFLLQRCIYQCPQTNLMKVLFLQ